MGKITRRYISDSPLSGYDYSSGVWQFEGYGTSGVCIMQVFGASTHATTLVLGVCNGALSYYNRLVIVPDIYDRWFRLNVIHDVEAEDVKVYIDGVLQLVAPGQGGASHNFTCGVYAQEDNSNCMESRWKDIKVFKKM
ncbi:unnamed protein product [Ilex paraguariensis]|uniref:Alginate lyase 2 domain-containing protein n=1 Tax=Ilex paraguariensis TaxID=185542 RepID=A0ABC8R3S7_9AQUA